jgi:hypothetical protein
MLDKGRRCFWRFGRKPGWLPSPPRAAAASPPRHRSWPRHSPYWPGSSLRPPHAESHLATLRQKAGGAAVLHHEQERHRERLSDQYRGRRPRTGCAVFIHWTRMETGPAVRSSQQSTGQSAPSFFRSEYLNVPVSPLHIFGRQQDVALQKARNTISLRNHLRLWLAPFTVDGQQVWVGQSAAILASSLLRNLVPDDASG